MGGKGAEDSINILFWKTATNGEKNPPLLQLKGESKESLGDDLNERDVDLGKKGRPGEEEPPPYRKINGRGIFLIKKKFNAEASRSRETKKRCVGQGALPLQILKGVPPPTRPWCKRGSVGKKNSTFARVPEKEERISLRKTIVPENKK